MKCLKYLLILALIPLTGKSQSLSGQVKSGKKVLEGVLVVWNEGQEVTRTDEEGKFKIASVVFPGRLKLKFTGFLTIDTLVAQAPAGLLALNMQGDPLLLNEVVVTGTRSEMNRQQAPVMVQRIDARLLERAQAATVAEGLAYTPGLRIENNCQNCGFTQIRLNGLSGPYTQILLNGRPVFSALAGVYGLEQFPAAMIDRVEVVRGGGSALYGGNAIAGTVNIITKEPMDDRMELTAGLQILPGGRIDHRQNVYASSRFGSSSVSIYAGNRERQWWDANNDGFSELTQLSLQNIGLNFKHDLNRHHQLLLDVSLTRENRRGGSDFDLAPHQSRIAEALEHQNTGISLAWEYRNPNQKERFSVYSSLRHISRASYYGAGGRVLTPLDTLTPTDFLAMNAYGNTADWSLAQGFQWNRTLNASWRLVAGAEWQWMKVKDEMLGYQRIIDQQSSNLGQYAQLQWEPGKSWTILVGGRLDAVNFSGVSRLGSFTSFPSDRQWIAVPRLSVLYKYRQNWKFRAGYAEGYRTSQVFDEDLHIESVGGAARFIKFSPDLRPEFARSFTASADFTRQQINQQWNWQSEFFITRLENPFLYGGAIEENGFAFQWKRNGSGATVMGLHQEWRWAFRNDLQVQLGFTLQTARYLKDEVIWEDTQMKEIPSVTTRDILRNPELYGFGTVEWKPDRWNFSLNMQYTGSMKVPHVVGIKETIEDPSGARGQYTRLVNTPNFLDLGIRAGRSWNAGGHYRITLMLQVANLFNSFQNNFDAGPNRDAGFVYGPLRPRNWGFTLQIGHK